MGITVTVNAMGTPVELSMPYLAIECIKEAEIISYLQIKLVLLCDKASIPEQIGITLVRRDITKNKDYLTESFFLQSTFENESVVAIFTPELINELVLSERPVRAKSLERKRCNIAYGNIERYISEIIINNNGKEKHFSLGCELCTPETIAQKVFQKYPNYNKLILNICLADSKLI